MESTVYLSFAAAYVRGYHRRSPAFDLPAPLREKPLEVLSIGELEQIYAVGREAGLKLHRYKRSNILPRVQKVLGMLRGIQPIDLLDIGSGRGAFLWPLMDSLPDLPVTAIDACTQRAEQLQMVETGGLERLSAHQMDATALDFEDGLFDVVTALEVLEHIPQTWAAINEIVRVARRFVIVSAPSKKDNNPEHIHTFTQASIIEMFAGAGVDQVKFDYVHNHMIAMAVLV
ncbi:MAG: class I SAM-dependent methyltransferase [Anaerolineae bacterium]|nr:class I SAM-dependent methyltransferase [Anaerolineae bacterium]